MIRAIVGVDCVALVGALPLGSLAYVDRDWLPASSQPVPSIGVTPDGALDWCDGPPVQSPSSVDPDTAAALVLLAFGREAAATVQGLPPASVEITGRGVIAHLVRVLTAAAAQSTADRPRAIVDVTGDPDVIVDATRRVADLGTVVLAGEALGRRIEMNLYPDVHARGLTLVGVAPPMPEGAFRRAEIVPDDSLLEWCRESLVSVASGAHLPAGAAWYRVSS